MDNSVRFMRHFKVTITLSLKMYYQLICNYVANKKNGLDFLLF
jgi:hypothetical protein